MGKLLRFRANRLVCVAFLITVVASCKKDKPVEPLPVDKETPASILNLRDTITDIARDYYLWNKNIPASFNPKKYSTTNNFADLIGAIQTYSPFNPVNNKYYDHFSFVVTEADYQKIFVRGESQGFGVDFQFGRGNKLRVSYVAKASSAYSSGIRRGWEVTSIGGVSTAGASGDQATLDRLNQALSSSSVNVQFINPSSGGSLSLQLSQSSISDDEVITAATFDEGAKKIGYIAYNTFLTALSDPNPKKGIPLHPGLDQAFGEFAGKGITDMIIDLRYNGGGYTDVAAEMANALIPESFNGQLLYSELYNKTLNDLYKNGYTEIAHDNNVLINKLDPRNPPGLKINSVVFITSRETASASELVINSLLPYIPVVKIIGVGLGREKDPETQRTAGKPFGYSYEFEIPEKSPLYVAFLLNFESKNARGEDNYVSGFVPDLQTYDGLEFDWGNPLEDALRAALNFEATGVLTAPPSPISIGSGRIAVAGGGYQKLSTGRLNSHRFSGMVGSDAIRRR